jgi:hypothetical protein
MPDGDDPRPNEFLGGSPGASGPHDPAYGGAATLGDEGGAAGPESFVEPNATEEEAEAAVTPEVRELWSRAEAQNPD